MKLDVTLDEECTVVVFENTELRGIFKYMTDEVGQNLIGLIN
jgi:hypothetical protein